MFEQLGLIGCGLIGGSLALALKREGLVKRVVGYSKSPSTTERARQLGVIDVAAPSALLAVSAADLVVVAVPVSASEAAFRAILHGLAPNTLVMDVGSTKGDVVAAAQRALQHRFNQFVPAHPIAGKEVAGVEHAEAGLFAQRQVILTPLPETLHEHQVRASMLWTAIGARVQAMTPEAHDAAFAAVSHVPHLLAFACVNALLAQPAGAQLLQFAGTGFRDFTRIAASDPAVWRDILLANSEQVLRQSQAFRHMLLQLESIIAVGDGEALERAIASARQARLGLQPDAAPAAHADLTARTASA